MSSIFSTPELAIGIAVGGAAGAAFEPKLEIPKQTAWANNPQRLPDVALIAALVAGGKVSMEDGQNMAGRLGFDHGPFHSLTWLAQDRLNFPLMLRMWRLAAVNPNFDEATLSTLLDETLAHEQLDWNYQPYLRALKHAELPGIGDIAYGVVRGMLPAPSWVPVAPPTTTTNVKRFPMVDIDPVKLAAALGYDENMLQLMVGRSGLSLAPGLAAQAFFRGIIADDDYHLAIAEGDLRTEWAGVLRHASRQIPTAENFVEAHLRGWIDKQAMYDGTALHGMTQPDTDIEFQIHRRPLTPHQVKQALARGAHFNPEAGEIQDPYTASVHQANLGPEWYEMGVSLQGAYPSVFQTNRLVTGGTIAPADGKSWLERSGYADEVVTAFVKSWGSETTAAADPHVTKAENQLWTTTHASYKAQEITDATATAALSAAGVAAAAIPAILALWAHERSLIRKQLSPTQIRKALNLSVVNPATGVPWTIADAHAALLERGYDDADATVFLQE